MMTTHEPLTFQDGLDPMKQLERFCQELREGDAFLAVEIEQSTLLVQFDREALVLAAYTPTKETLHNNKDLLQVRLSAYAPGCKLRIHGLLTDAQIAARENNQTIAKEIGHRGEHWWNYRPLPARYTSGERISIPWEYNKTPGQEIHVTKIDGLDTPYDYVLARHLGQWIAYGRRDNVCWGYGPWEREVRCLLGRWLGRRLGRAGVEDIDAQLSLIKHRDKDAELCRLFCRAEAEITYITCQKLSYDKVKSLKTYEDVYREIEVDWHCHHIFPCGAKKKKENQGKEYPEYMASFWNLVMVPVDIHRKIHKAYSLVDSGIHWRAAFRREFPDSADIVDSVGSETFSFFVYDWLKYGENYIPLDDEWMYFVRVSPEICASICIYLYMYSTSEELVELSKFFEARNANM